MKNVTPIKLAVFFVVCLGLMLVPLGRTTARLRVASKKFTESVVLGEMLRLLAESQQIPVVHLSELGGTRLVFDVLRSGEIDAYAEYTGTIRQEILAGMNPDEDLADRLRQMGIEMSEPLGFNNTYAIGLTQARAAELGVSKISDLRRFPDLRLGFSNEFLDRADGWPQLKRTYQLPQDSPRGLDHDIAYRQLDAGFIDAIDVYTTDAKVGTYDLFLLEDDLQYFPRYDAVWLFRADLANRFPDFVAAMQQFGGRISAEEMVSLNELVESGEANEAAAAARYLRRSIGLETAVQQDSVAERIWQRTVEHLDLVRRSLIAAILVGIPLGVLAQRYRRFGQSILAATGLIQTIPALALLVMLIPVAAALGLSSVGTGSETAVLALFGYSLLPIVRNTHAGLSHLAQETRESAAVLGLTTRAQLLEIELPLAAPTILAGIKTAAVQNVGFAALGALIGAGGYGQPILTGIRLNSTPLILEGAVPAAVLAVLVQVAFEWAERWIVPRGLRLGA